MSAWLSAHPLGPFAAYDSWAVEAAVAVAVLAIAAVLGASRLDRIAEWLFKPRDPVTSRRLAIALAASTLILGIVVATAVLDRFPNSADEYGDLFLAETLAAGRLWNDVPTPVEFFSPIHIAAKDGKWVARYPPGWASLIAAAGRPGLPAWALNALLAALTILVVWRIAERFVGVGTGPAAALLTLAAGFFVFHAGSYRSHVSTGLWVLAGTYLLACAVDEEQPRRAVLAGLAFGVAFLTRPYTTLLCALPLGGYVIAGRRAAAWRTLLPVVAGALPGVLVLLLYNRAITGDPFLMVTTWMDPDEGLGFRHGHTLVAGMKHALRRVAALLEWANPTLPFVAAWTAWRTWREDRRDLFAWIGAMLPMLIVGHVVYHAFGGTQYGPRFYFEAWPFVALVALAGMLRFPGPWGRRAVVVGLVFAVVTIPFAAMRLHAVVQERQDAYRLAQREGIENAVVLLASPTGVRWPMPVQDLLRNGIELEGEVLWAHDRGEDNARLRAAMPGRTFYRYAREPGETSGRLERLP